MQTIMRIEKIITGKFRYFLQCVPCLLLTGIGLAKLVRIMQK